MPSDLRSPRLAMPRGRAIPPHPVSAAQRRDAWLTRRSRAGRYSLVPSVQPAARPGGDGPPAQHLGECGGDIDDAVRAVHAEAAAGGRVRADLLAVPIEVATICAEMLCGWAIAAGPSRRLH